MLSRDNEVGEWGHPWVSLCFLVSLENAFSVHALLCIFQREVLPWVWEALEKASDAV